MKRHAPSSVRLGRDVPAAIRHAAAEWRAREDAGLAPAEQAALKAWLGADARHRDAYARFGQVWAALDRPHEAGATAVLAAALDGQARRRRQRRQIASAATLLVVLAAAGTAWHFFPGLAPQSSAASVAATTSRAVLLEPARQTLPDGTVVELKEGADFSPDFTATLRRVVLHRGEAHFQVTKDVLRPFVVVAAGVEAQAVGTAFAVQIGESAVDVVVTQGRVALNRTAAAAPASSSATATVPAAPPSVPTSAESFAPLAVLDASDRARVELGRGAATEPPRVTVIRGEETEDRLAWRIPRVEFTRTALAEAVAILNRHADARRAAEPAGTPARPGRFILADAALGAVPVSGLFRVDRTEAFVSLLRDGFGIEAETQPDGEIVLRRAGTER